MWRHMARIVGEIRPRYVFVENSPALITRGLGVVLDDLAALGYDCKWTVLGAADVGAPHQRDRFWLVGSDALRAGCAPVYGRGVVHDENRHGAGHETGRNEQQSRFSGDCAEMADADSALSQGGGNSMTRKDGKSRSDMLDWVVEYQTGMRLNPMWVEWLMGWPLGWTDLKPLEMDRCQPAPQQHGDC